VKKEALGFVILTRLINYLNLLIFISSALKVKTVYKSAVYFLKRYILLQNVPNAAYLALTFRCQFDCKYCGIALYPDNLDELSFRSWLKVIDQLSELGVFRIEFTGGEPTIRNDLENLIGYAHEKGFITVLSTNGWGLDEKRLIQMKKSGLNCLCVSLDGVGKKMHEEASNKDGSFLQAVKVINLCRKNHIKCIVSTILTRDIINSGNLTVLLKFCEKFKLAGVRLTSPLPVGRWKSKSNEIISDIEKKMAEHIINNHKIPLIGRGIKNGVCAATSNSAIFISPSGEIQPCGYIPYSFGNVLRNDIAHVIQVISKDEMFSEKSRCKLQNIEFIEKYINEINPDAELPVKTYETSQIL